MNPVSSSRPAWRTLLAAKRPLVLPVAHDALSARLIARAGFEAYSIGGFPLVGARYGLPDIGLVGLGEMIDGMRDIIAASPLPVLVDADHGYGDVKNVTRTVRAHESIGASALFIEDQVAPKRCGHMAGKEVVPTEVMEAKLRAAAAARTNPDTFLMARTDARAVHGLDEALRRGERYIKAGADCLFIEAPENVEELKRIGAAFRGVPQMANMLEGGGRTPILSPRELYDIGFSMIAYPTTLLFRVARAIERGLADLKAGRPAPAAEMVGFDDFKDMVGFADWAAVENRFAKSKPESN